MAGIARREWPVGAEDDTELVRLAQRGDRDAAAELLVRHELVVHRTCARLLPAGEDVEAAAQESLLRALKALPSFAGKSSFPSWLVAIAINLCRDRMRRRRLVPFIPLESGTGEDDGPPSPLDVVPARDADPERSAMARQAVGRLTREVRRLPDRQREVFVLRFFVELPLEEIAAALAVDVGTVKTHLHRAVQRVRRAVEEAVP